MGILLFGLPGIVLLTLTLRYKRKSCSSLH
jgi:hypothetical protein